MTGLHFPSLLMLEWLPLASEALGDNVQGISFSYYSCSGHVSVYYDRAAISLGL